MTSSEILAAVVSIHTAAILALLAALFRTRERVARLEGRLNGQR